MCQKSTSIYGVFLQFLERQDTVPVTPYGCANFSKGGAENFVVCDTDYRFLMSEVVVAGCCRTQWRLFQEQAHLYLLSHLLQQAAPPLPVWSQHQT